MDDNFVDIDAFLDNSILNDSKNNSGVLRLNRFFGVIEGVPKGEGGGQLAWNIFKVDCPSLSLEVESREVDMAPRIYFKNYRYDDLAISYIESSELLFRRFFSKWMRNVLDPLSYTRNYYDNVKASTFDLYPINFEGKTFAYDRFHDLVPFDINSINYDMQDDGSSTVLTTVKFKYLRHEILP